MGGPCPAGAQGDCLREGLVCTREDTRQVQWEPREHWPRGRVLQGAPLVSALLTVQMGSPGSGAGQADQSQLSIAPPDL